MWHKAVGVWNSTGTPESYLFVALPSWIWLFLPFILRPMQHGPTSTRGSKGKKNREFGFNEQVLSLAQKGQLVSLIFSVNLLPFKHVFLCVWIPFLYFMTPIPLISLLFETQSQTTSEAGRGQDKARGRCNRFANNNTTNTIYDVQRTITCIGQE